jgi:hypothetical protein
MLTRILLGGSQFGHFAAASLISSMYLRCAFSFERKIFNKLIVEQYEVSVGLGVWRLREMRD